jgi:hypothetical protein
MAMDHESRVPAKAAPTAQELEQQRRRRIYDEQKSLSAYDLKDFPTEAKYWGLKTESHTYDSGYGERGQPDMTTSHSWSITVFESEEALEAWVLDRVERRETYRVIRAEPVKTEVKAVFSVLK